MKEPLLKIGRYEVLEKMASGGMAEVYRAKITGTHGFEKEVALKVLHPHLSREKEFVDMFTAEGRIGALLNHPNIVSVLDFGEVEGSFFIALELFDGVPLSDIIREAFGKSEKGESPALHALYCAREALKGLKFAHNKCDQKGNPLKIVHRDISPQNILASRDGQIKLCDFGIAKGKHREDLTENGFIKGKVNYMSPEQARGEQVDEMSDIYSAGLVLFEMLGGETSDWKKGADQAVELAAAAKGLPLEKIEGLDAVEEVKRILKLALSPDKGGRYQSSAVMLRDLSEALAKYDPDYNEEKFAEFLKRMPKKRQKKEKRKAAAPGEEHLPGDYMEVRLRSARIIALIAALFAAIALIITVLQKI
ncbi:MAG: serine/threonine protein kinase [Deltaproteobacteria bacterium]|nr:serine/threonine protein kinase [Deltaproteobacteria bacterium]